jgi:hypothetical protein
MRSHSSTTSTKADGFRRIEVITGSAGGAGPTRCKPILIPTYQYCADLPWPIGNTFVISSESVMLAPGSWW